MASNYVEYYLQLYNRRTGAPIDDDSGLFSILTASSPVVLTAYSDAQGTSLTQPATMTNGVIRFFLDSATTSCDVTVLTSTGRAYFLEGVAVSQHRVDVDPEKTEYQFVAPWNGGTACNAVADTGYDLLNGMIVQDVYVHVTTNTTATAIDVGISGSTAGFFSKAVSSATGFKFANVVVISSETACVSIVASTQKRGLLLVDFSTGFSATATVGGSRGWFAKKPYVVTASTSLVYIVDETNSAGTGSGYIYVQYDLAQSAGN